MCAVFVPLFRLMSDRESVSGASRPRLGFVLGRTPLNRTARVQRRLCVSIRILSVLLKERESSGSVPKMIEIRRSSRSSVSVWEPAISDGGRPGIDDEI